MAKILSIDDDPELQDLISMLLKGRGHAVEWAFSGEEGFAKAQSLKPDLILLDMMLPTLNGMEVLKMLKADPALSGIPVVVVTAFFAEVAFQEKEVRELGAVEFLRKPVQNELLSDVIEGALAAR